MTLNCVSIKSYFNKFSNTITKQDKDKAWEQITDKVNAVNRVGFKRSVEDIKKKYTTFSSDVRKKAAQISTHSRRTGGGPPIELHLSETGASIVATINPQLIEGITGGIDTE